MKERQQMQKENGRTHPSINAETPLAKKSSGRWIGAEGCVDPTIKRIHTLQTTMWQATGSRPSTSLRWARILEWLGMSQRQHTVYIDIYKNWIYFFNAKLFVVPPHWHCNFDLQRSFFWAVVQSKFFFAHSYIYLYISIYTVYYIYTILYIYSVL